MEKVADECRLRSQEVHDNLTDMANDVFCESRVNDAPKHPAEPIYRGNTPFCRALLVCYRRTRISHFRSVIGEACGTSRFNIPMMDFVESHHD